MNDSTTVKDLKRGDYFCLKPQNEQEVSGRKVWVKGDYLRSKKRYEIYRFDDVNHYRFVKGSTPAFTDFTF